MSKNESDGKRKQKRERYAYLKLPVAAPADAASRREFLIRQGVIIPASEKYACGHGDTVAGPYCPTCGQSAVVVA